MLAGPLTFGRLFGEWREHRAPLLCEARRQAGEAYVKLFLAGLGEDLRVDDLSPSHVESYAAARRAGTLTPFVGGKDARGRKLARKPVAVTDGTINGDFRWR